MCLGYYETLNIFFSKFNWSHKFIGNNASVKFLLCLILATRRFHVILFNWFVMNWILGHMIFYEKTNIYRISYILFKAILQVLIYKALYDKSYLGSKTTMTSGEWTCLISFATAPLTCSERGGSEKFKMKIYVSSGIRTHTPPVHDREVAGP